MRTPTYSIYSFDWDDATNTFYAERYYLVSYDGVESSMYGNKQFYIENSYTGNRRRFRFLKELEGEYGEVLNLFQFCSEETNEVIYCILS